MKKIIIVSPSLKEEENVSGISTITKFIINQNKDFEYIHFCLGKKDREKTGINRIFSLCISYIKWIKLLIRTKSIIHYNFPLSKFSILRDPFFIILAILFRKKIIIHIHGGIFLFSNKIPTIYNAILKKIFNLNVPFIVLSEKEKLELSSKYNCKSIYILPNSIDLTDSLSFNRKVNISSALRIGYLGRITEEKGISYLLKACKELKEKNINFTIKIAGGEEKNTNFIPLFSKLLNEKFKYEGIISGKSKSIFLENIDIFILPSYFEGLPMSLVESMSFGVVPITTDVGSINEIIENNINGLFIEVKDVDSIVTSIIKLSNNRELLKELSINAKRTIILKFNPQKYISQLNYIYKQL